MCYVESFDYAISVTVLDGTFGLLGEKTVKHYFQHASFNRTV